MRAFAFHEVLDATWFWCLSDPTNELLTCEGKFGENPALSRNRVSNYERIFRL